MPTDNNVALKHSVTIYPYVVIVAERHVLHNMESDWISISELDQMWRRDVGIPPRRAQRVWEHDVLATNL
jgi:hypothetical protein